MKEKFSSFLQFDRKWLSSWNKFANNAGIFQGILKFVSEYLIYSLPVILIITWFWSAKSKIVSLKALFSAGLAAILSNIIGRIINRPRPFEVSGVHELVFHRPSYSFPSDHATVLFAVAFAFYFAGYKKLFWFVLALAIIISFSRIVTGLHYPSDIISGAILGILVAAIIWRLQRPLSYIYNLIIIVAKKLRLA